MIYLDNAATSYPKPPEVLRRVEEAFLLYGANPGRGSYSMSNETSCMVQDTRFELACLLHAPYFKNLIFTPSATEALNIAINGVLKKGDHVVISGLEHNAVYRPIKYLEQEKNISISIVKPDKYGKIKAADFAKAIRKNTALLICLHASNVTGNILPVEQICFLGNQKGIPVLIDASQSAGILPIDIENWGVDMLAVAGHKSLLGPMGLGALYIAPHLNLKPFVKGGTGSLSEQWQQPDFYPDRFESGTMNIPGICGLLGGLEYIQKEMPESIYRKEYQLTQYFMEEIAKLDGVYIYGPPAGEERVPLVTLNVDNFEPQELAALLSDRYDIATRAGYQCTPLAHFALGDRIWGGLRFSVGAFNTFNDIENALRAMYEIVAKRYK